MEPGPLAIIPARMELVSSSSEAVERAMVDPESLALKRARSPSPEITGGDRQLVVAPKKGPRPVRPARKNIKGQRLLLLPAPAPVENQVRKSEPCMDSPLVGEDGGTEVHISAPSVLLVNVPVEDCGERGGVSGVKAQGRRVKKEGEGSSGVGGPIRREKVKSSAAACKGEIGVRTRKNKGGERVGGGKGKEKVAVGREVQAVQSPVCSNGSSPRGGLGCGGGSGKGAGSGAESPKSGRMIISSGVNLREGAAEASPSSGGGRGRVGGKKGGLGSPRVAAPSRCASSRSPVKGKGNLFGGKSQLVNREGGKVERDLPGHGELVELIRGAVREADGGERGVEEGEGGGDRGGTQ